MNTQVTQRRMITQAAHDVVQQDRILSGLHAKLTLQHSSPSRQAGKLPELPDLPEQINQPSLSSGEAKSPAVDRDATCSSSGETGNSSGDVGSSLRTSQHPGRLM